MRRKVVILLILSFAGVSVFGFLGMGFHEIGHDMSSCIAALQKGTGCPMSLGPLGFAVFHLNAFKIFSSANIDASVLLSSVLLALMLFAAVVLKPSYFRLLTVQMSTADRYFDDYRRSYEFCAPNELKFMHWLALHEKRDPAF